MVKTVNKIELPVRGGEYARLTADQLQKLDGIGTATASAILHRMGITRTYIQGPAPMQTGKRIVGSALTLQFMPQREDIASGVSQEYAERTSALWAVFDASEAGDILVIQAEADPYTGCVGEMLASYLQLRGGLGVVIDGRVRDWPKVSQLDFPFWTTGTTPNYASQGGLFPWAYDVPVNCGGALVLPGDAIIADDDGVVVVPQALIDDFSERCHSVSEWEEFARLKIDAGGRLSKYYPLSDEAVVEYEEWQRTKDR